MTASAGVTVADVIEAVRRKKALLAPETAGYLVLGAADQIAGQPALVDEHRCGVLVEAGRIVVKPSAPSSQADAERALAPSLAAPARRVQRQRSGSQHGGRLAGEGQCHDSHFGAGVRAHSRQPRSCEPCAFASRARSAPRARRQDRVDRRRSPGRASDPRFRASGRRGGSPRGRPGCRDGARLRGGLRRRLRGGHCGRHRAHRGGQSRRGQSRRGAREPGVDRSRQHLRRGIVPSFSTGTLATRAATTTSRARETCAGSGAPEVRRGGNHRAPAGDHQRAAADSLGVRHR